MKLSIHLFLTDVLPHKKKFLNRFIKNKLFDQMDTKEIFESFKKHNIEGIELLLPSFVTVHDIAEVKKTVDSYGIKIFSVHQSLRFLTRTKMSEIRDLMEAAKILSAKVVVLHMNSAGMQIFDDKYIAQIHALQKQYGIKIGFENREKYFGSLLNGYGWHEKKFADLIKKKDLYITYDVCHMGQAGGDIVRFFEDNKDRIINVHLSDYKHHYLNTSLRPIRFKHLPLGKGELPIKRLLSTLKRENYNGLLTLETNVNLKELIESSDMVKNTT